MGTSGIPVDLKGRYQRRPVQQFYLKVQIMDMTFICTQIPRPISAQDIICTDVLILADLGNAQGIIYVGGQACNINCGIPLDAGRGISYSAEHPNLKIIRAAYGGWGADMIDPPALDTPSPPDKIEVISLHDILLTGLLGGEVARIQYKQWII
jgi:hypothetical protein